MKLLTLVALVALTSCSHDRSDSQTSAADTAVYCQAEGSKSWLTRRADDQRLGSAMPTEDCQQAVAAANHGVVCTLNLYQGRSGYAPTAIRYPRATGHSGTRGIATCNRMIAHANNLTVCSYSGSSLGWKTTRTYALPGEPARYPHRFGASNPNLEECLAVAQGSLVIFEEDRVIHQTCRWGGSEWYPTCGSDSSRQMRGRAGSAATCLASIQEPQPGCNTPLTEELRALQQP